jgi:hypothetical protein
MKQANKLKGEKRESFLKEYYEVKERLKEQEKPKPPKKIRKQSKSLNGRVEVSQREVQKIKKVQWTNELYFYVKSEDEEFYYVTSPFPWIKRLRKDECIVIE